MQFVSTRGEGKSVGFTEAMFNSLAPDGGLYCPKSMVNLGNFFLELPEDIEFNRLCSRLTASLLSPEIASRAAEEIVREAFDFEPTLHRISEYIQVLELFHGPSCAFKDFGAAFLASAMSRLLAGKQRRVIILTATSGDTGSAVAKAFHGKQNIDVVILYPSKRVSPLQEKQLSTLGGNITTLEVDGSFDDCQRMVKAAFINPSLSHLPLCSANSINLARLIPQSFYYVWAWTRLRSMGDFAFIVPSGNFGNIAAGLYAAAWGLPVKHFVAATNANKTIPQYLETGNYIPRPSISTYSNAMDVGAPSNFERLDYLYNHDVGVFRNHVMAWSVSDADTIDTMSRVERDFNYLCCPHTAVGWKVAELYREKNPTLPAVILATAHPGKFMETVKKATGKTPKLPASLAAMMRDKKNVTALSGNDAALSEWLRQQFRE